MGFLFKERWLGPGSFTNRSSCAWEQGQQAKNCDELHMRQNRKIKLCEFLDVSDDQINRNTTQATRRTCPHTFKLQSLPTFQLKLVVLFSSDRLDSFLLEPHSTAVKKLFSSLGIHQRPASGIVSQFAAPPHNLNGRKRSFEMPLRTVNLYLDYWPSTPEINR